jgi:hypothetical protein
MATNELAYTEENLYHNKKYVSLMNGFWIFKVHILMGWILIFPQIIHSAYTNDTLKSLIMLKVEIQWLETFLIIDSNDYKNGNIASLRYTVLH